MTTTPGPDTLMKTNPKNPQPMKTEQSQSPPPPSRKLRDDPVFQSYYNSILNGIFASSFGPITDWQAFFDKPCGAAFDEASDHASILVTIAHRAACLAHMHAYVAEYHGDDEIEQFNASIEANGNGDEHK